MPMDPKDIKKFAKKHHAEMLSKIKDEPEDKDSAAEEAKEKPHGITIAVAFGKPPQKK